MQHLIDETAKRREVQKKYNKENGISPKTILKSIDEISLSTSVADEREDEMIKAIDSNDLNINFENMDKVEMQDVISSLERKMKKAAENMKFEVAAIYRDQIKELKQGAVK